MRLVIAVDGLSGSGKGVLSRGIADFYGIACLDTGKLYRAVAFRALKSCAMDNHQEILALASSLSLDSILEHSSSDLSGEHIAAAASIISTMPEVRQALLDLQRDFAYNFGSGAVLDGRDIGTVVCPDATHKIFVTADIEVRSKRRHKELQDSGVNLTLDVVREALLSRDDRDKKRLIAPLLPAKDAYCIDTSCLDIDTMVRMAVNFISI